MNILTRSFAHWASQPMAARQVAQNDLCEACHKKPKFSEGGVRHLCCSRSCARNLQSKSSAPCALRECRTPAKEGSTFCSDGHGREAVRLNQVEGCAQCKVQPRTVDDRCLFCHQRPQTSSRLREISESAATFQSVKTLFEDRWCSPETVPRVERIVEIVEPRGMQARRDAYCKQFSSSQEIVTYHSSQCICDLGVKDLTLCGIKACGICNIVRSSFRAHAFGVPHNDGRFGPGIYSYENSASADRFSTSCLSSPYRVMIACKATILPTGGTPIQSPMTPSQNSNESSIFVPTAEAIVPTYLILYTRLGSDEIEEISNYE